MKEKASDQKLRGGYYTPTPIADFLCEWAIQTNNDTILEPSCGDGVILESAAKTLIKLQCKKVNTSGLLNGIELNGEEAIKAKDRLYKLGLYDVDKNIHTGDFFEYYEKILTYNNKFDVIVGNPPFIRYQDCKKEQMDIAFRITRSVGLELNKLTNIWVPFLVSASLLLKENGRLAMVIPAELFQVGYAAQIRRFLSDFYKKITVITFKKLVFPDIQQEVILLLAEKNATTEGISILEIEDIDMLNTYKKNNFFGIELKPIEHTGEKWTQYFLKSDEIELLHSLKQSRKLTNSRDAIDVDVGVVTGNNDFFIVKSGDIQNEKSYTTRMVTRSAHLNGLVFTEEDWNGMAERLLPSRLLSLNDTNDYDQYPQEIKELIKLGQKHGVNEGYKCRIRKKWYIVPSVWIPEAFMLRQVHAFPKIVFNEARASCTDTIHRVRFKKNIDGRVICGAFVNSLTFAFSEITGRSYGGGVLTFEPSEAENIPIPLMGAEKLDLEKLDYLFRQEGIYAVLDYTDDILLKDGLGLSKGEIVKIRGIWEKLRDRRIYRKNNKK
ncbi:modification methylase Eco57IB [Ruminiclostridium hungatei]|uniref:site-specific DNA-methyltransferase (adenine-specific) n=1 Tax=Ruminiclostridium hungatei TaxID=48256 RepID=A0A1V4SDT3_RUMHU|nr:class I SAM-dependent methyltransferase [Ruminiclostridium hungatei]OPX41893.1 modification methylase Eco57IB [Ruminiclostridium hungatei]